MQDRVFYTQAELAAARLNLAEKELRRAGKAVEEQGEEYHFPTPTTSELELVEQKVEKQAKRSVTKLITYQAFLGATLQDNMALEVHVYI